MTTNATSGAQAATAPTATGSPRSASGGNSPGNTLGQDAFLHLLVTQLQHQDPTQPQDDAQFIAQLAQFSSLEQLQQMNQTLSQLVAAIVPPTTGAAVSPDATGKV